MFYQLLSGGDKDKYMLQPAKSFEFLKASDCYTLDGVDDAQVSLAYFAALFFQPCVHTGATE